MFLNQFRNKFKTKNFSFNSETMKMPNFSFQFNKHVKNNRISPRGSGKNFKKIIFFDHKKIYENKESAHFKSIKILFQMFGMKKLPFPILKSYKTKNILPLNLIKMLIIRKLNHSMRY